MINLQNVHTDSKGVRLATAPKGWPFGRVPVQVPPVQDAPF